MVYDAPPPPPPPPPPCHTRDLTYIKTACCFSVTHPTNCTIPTPLRSNKPKLSLHFGNTNLKILFALECPVILFKKKKLNWCTQPWCLCMCFKAMLYILQRALEVAGETYSGHFSRQMHRENKCHFNGTTNYSRVWRKGARKWDWDYRCTTGELRHLPVLCIYIWYH